MGQPRTKKKLGIWMSTSLVVGNMIGAGIFLMPSALAPYGGISIVGWLTASFGAIVLAFIFGKLSSLVKNSNGGPYAFAKAGFGDFLGFLVAWGYWISIWVSNAAIAIAFVGALSVFIPELDSNPLMAVLAALAAIWGLTWVNSLGVRSSGKMQLVTTLLKLLPLVIIITGGFFFFESDNFIPFNASEFSFAKAVAATAAMTFFAFLGIESATIPASDIKDSEKTIPLATNLGTMVTTLVYILSTVVIMGMIPLDSLAKSPAPFADAMGIMVGSTGEKLVAAGAAIAAFGALNGWILIMGQVAKATAKDKLFPELFASDNKAGVPLKGMIIGSILSTVVMLMNYTEGLVEQFRFMILLGTLCTLVPYLFSAATFVLLGTRQQTKQRSVMLVYLLGGVGFLFSLWMIYGTGEESVFWGTLLLLAGTPVYVWMKQKKS